MELVENGTIPILDLLFVMKDADGVVTTLEAADLDEDGAAFDPVARTCDTTMELTSPREGDSFCERRQYFRSDADVRAVLDEAGFVVVAVGEEYTHEPAGASTLRATWSRGTSKHARRALRPTLLRHPADEDLGQLLFVDGGSVGVRRGERDL